MKESSKLLFAPGWSDLHEGINVPRMREERAARARKIMKKQNIPALLVTGANNVRYLVGFRWNEFQAQLSYTLFFAEGDPVVYAHAGSFHQMPDQAPWIKDWRIGRSWFGGVAGPEASAEEAQIFAREIKEELKKRGLLKEKLAVVDFDVLAREALKEEGIHVVEGAYLLLEASQVKTVDEINCLKVVASIGSIPFQVALDSMKPGMTQDQFSELAQSAMGGPGVDFSRAKANMGPAAFERGVTVANRRIEYGDAGYVLTCGTSFLGYTACLYRSYVVGRRPTAKEQDWYRQLRDRIEAIIEAMRPGNTTADAAKFYPPASKWGYKDEAEVLSVECGHGIGLVHIGASHAHYNWPVINRQWSLKHPQVFEPGMVVAIESLEGEHRQGGFRLEHMVLITENGPELLDYFPREEILLAAR